MRHTILQWIAYVVVLHGILLHDQFIHQRGTSNAVSVVLFGADKQDKGIIDPSSILEVGGSRLERGND
jgi:hypothetical protein